MKMRFSTQAANADILGEDTPNATEGLAEGGSEAAPRQHGGPKTRRPETGATPDGQAKPGKDINAAGFVKDKDAGEP